jgi:hypothetical protein
LATLRARGPYPWLAISGEQGSAKTILSKMLKQAIAARDTATLSDCRRALSEILDSDRVPGGAALAVKHAQHLMLSDQYERRSKLTFPRNSPRFRTSSLGASAEIYLMDGSPALQGTVSSVARGITDQDNKDGPQLLSSINPTFTWVRLAQRIPVTVHLARVPPGMLVSAGNDLHRRDEGRRGASTRARHQESHGGTFLSTFEFGRSPSLSRATCAPLLYRTVRAHHALDAQGHAKNSNPQRAPAQRQCHISAIHSPDSQGASRQSRGFCI